MADVTRGKNTKNLNSFADDLDDMLKAEGVEHDQSGQVIEDDDAIDRLLMGESFNPPEDEIVDKYDDIEALIADDLAENTHMSFDIDDLDDFGQMEIAALQQDVELQSGMGDSVETEPDSEWDDMFDEPVAADLNEIEDFAEIDAEVELADRGIPNFVNPVPAADLNSDHAKRRIPPVLQAEFDISADEDDFFPQQKSASPPAKEPVIETDTLAEIDETEPGNDINENALLADFDIIADAETTNSKGISHLIKELSEDAEFEEENRFAEISSEIELPPEPQFTAAIRIAEPELEVVSDEQYAVSEPEAPSTQPVVDHTAELALLNTQIADLNKQLVLFKKQHESFRQEITEKAAAANQELLGCLDSLESLQTEQKKAKRIVDGLNTKKPISAYVANGLAAVALLLGLGLAVQSFIAKTQMDEVVKMMAKAQEQASSAPGSEAADKELLRKELDSLAVADSVAGNQIAEIKKMLSGESSSARVSGDIGKQVSELSAQTMQMGNAIENLERHISALEKGRVMAAQPAAKAEKKKPVVIEENWAVNLIAFKQDWYAKRKAEEYASKGVAAKVSKSESKGEDWYRLSVDGFKSQYEAAAYAAKVKKTLNLDSVWVARVSGNTDKN